MNSYRNYVKLPARDRRAGERTRVAPDHDDMDAPPATEPSQTPAPTEEQPPAPQRPLQELLDEGSKSLATKQYAEATELFALALEQL